MERVNWNQAVRPSTHDLIAAINSGADDIERIDGALDDIETALDGKAGVSGTYPDFVAGEALSIRSGIRSNTFLSRALDADVADGIAEVDRILGNTVVWNQLTAAHEPYSHNMTISFPVGTKLVTNHKYLLMANFITDTPDSTINPCVYLYTRVNGTNTAVGSLFSNMAPYRGLLGNILTSQYDAVSDGTVARNDGTFWYWVNFGTDNTYTVEDIQLFDLTQMFGAGNEPQTIAEFEAQYGSDYKPYSAPVLLSSNIAGIQGASACEFPAQTLRGIGTAQDAMTRVGIERKIGIRDYASGDESDSSVRTDGTHTAYILATPATEPFTEPIDLTYRVEADGSEAWIVSDNTQSAAVTGEIGYPLDPARALITHESFTDFIDKLGAYLGATITETWDGSKYTYSFASGRSALLGSIEAEPDALEVTEKDDMVKEIIEDERKEL